MSIDSREVCARYGNDRLRLMDILNDVQAAKGCIPDADIDTIAEAVGESRVDVDQTVSFYHFFSKTPRGKYTVYLNNSTVAQMNGRQAVAEAFEKESGGTFDGVTGDGLIGLYSTACIGMSDQEPAAIINNRVFTSLTPEKVQSIVADMRAAKAVDDMIGDYGDGANRSDLIKAMVHNNIRKKGEVLFGAFESGAALRKCAGMEPGKVLEVIKASNLRGRGGAGFPTGMKWEFCAREAASPKYVFCNADEGEPGTFKDRVILTELPRMMFEGMAVAGYIVGAENGIVYLRAEYRYLEHYLQKVLDDMRAQNLLGANICGKKGFKFDVRIQFGAGAYVCGEESALIESAEGKRGEPRNRPPFPAQKGFLDKPTVVNNVETFCCAAQIVDKGAEWFRSLGSEQSAGTKLLSISGDCAKPGIYEVECGLTVAEMLDMAGATKDAVQAVQIGGPSGTCVAPSDFDKKIGFECYATGGSIIIIGTERNLLSVVHNFMEFFADESCGACVPCRAGTRVMCNMIKKIKDGKGSTGDIAVLLELADVMKKSNKCGLGQTAGNPVATTIRNMRTIYDNVISSDDMYKPGFDLESAVEESCAVVGRTPHFDGE
ncbi:MAG: hypothetical protein GF418_07100 [Chitinivibrionales bacterium]|nr:hypothetical protein [Chitinivibrionales bacterium]MBD3395378.1 hypothetical protein [Chitinivibrionales bacterium]